MAELILPTSGREHARERGTRVPLYPASLQASFLEAMGEFAAEGRGVRGSMLGDYLLDEAPAWESPEGFAAYVARVRAESVRPSDPAFVPHTTWWWVEGDEFLGRIDVRHRLTAGLLEVGGHIGYDVRRSRRRRGHGTAMLAAVLPEAHRLGIDLALLTCDDDNLASRRVIEANGGVLEDQRGRKLRFWVPTSAQTSSEAASTTEA